MTLPKSITRLVEFFERLPGIGPKTAQRLAFHLLHYPEEELSRFANTLIDLKKKTKLCEFCKNVTEEDVCSICSDSKRDKFTIAVVSGPLDVLSIEKTNFRGTYHVLHGIIDPLNNIGPEEIFVFELRDRLLRLLNEASFETIDYIEIILVLNTSMEGESTAMFISKMLKESLEDLKMEINVKISRIARGLPVGGDIEYADDVTLSRAIEGRSAF